MSREGKGVLLIYSVEEEYGSFLEQPLKWLGQVSSAEISGIIEDCLG